MLYVRKLILRMQSVKMKICAVLCLVGLACFSLYSWGVLKIGLIRSSNATVAGEVTSAPPSNRGILYYKYKIDGESYEGSSQGATGLEGEGDEVDVYYSSRFPGLSTLHNRKIRIFPEWGLMFFFAGFSVVFFLLWRKSDKERRQGGQ